MPACRIDALVVIVDGNRQGTLGQFLADDVLIEDFLDFGRGRDLGDTLRNLALFVFGKDLVAECNALVANVDRRAGDELPDRILGLAAEGAAKMLVSRHAYAG
jgi:hypothetical protein